MLPFNSSFRLGSFSNTCGFLFFSWSISRVSLDPPAISSMMTASVQCPTSLVAFFPPAVYQLVGSSAILLELLQFVFVSKEQLLQCSSYGMVPSALLSRRLLCVPPSWKGVFPSEGTPSISPEPTLGLPWCIYVIVRWRFLTLS